MKTHVIQLERYDDVTSVTDNITWSRANRVLLVWPRRGRVLTRVLDLVLVQRSCQAIGAQLACLVDDEDILDHAQELGIPVFRSIKTAQRMLWRRSRHKRTFAPGTRQPRAVFEERRLAVRPKLTKWGEHRWFRWGICGLGVAALVMVFLLGLPAARIELWLVQSEQSMEFPVYAGPNVASLNYSGGLPVHFLSVVLEGQDDQPATGTISIGETAALGRVRFTNLSDQSVIIPVGTRVQTLGDPAVQFEIVQDARLSAKPGATVDVDVRAVQLGSKGNVLEGAIQAVVGEVGARVKVTNLSVTTGGRNLATLAVTAEDGGLLRERLSARLKQQALQEVKNKLGPGQRLFPETLKMARVLREQQTPAVGTAADRVSLSVQMEFQVWTIQQADLQALAQVALNGSLPAGTTGIEPSLRIQDSSPPTFDQEQLRWNIRATRTLQAGWDGQVVIGAVAGRSVEVARQALAQQIQLVQAPVIEMTPTWWPVFPLLPGRIEVVVR